MMHAVCPTRHGMVGLALWLGLTGVLLLTTLHTPPPYSTAQPLPLPQSQTNPHPRPQTNQQSQPQPVQLSLPDQYDRVHDLAMYRGRVLVLIYGDKQSQAINQPLGEKLHVQFHPAARNLPPAQARMVPPTPVAGQPPGTTTPDVVVIPVACVGKVPAAVRTIVRNQIRRGSPDVPVWLDFEDTMQFSFGLTPGTSNAVVFDTLGRYRHRGSAVHEPAAYQQLVQIIEQCRVEAVNVAAALPKSPATTTNAKNTTTIKTTTAPR